MREYTVADVGTSAGSARVRRCKTVGHAPMHHQSHVEMHSMVRSNTTPAVQPIEPGHEETQLERHGLGIHSVSTPSRCGEASRAHSRQRRIFSNVDSNAALSTSTRSASRQARGASCERQCSLGLASPASAFPGADYAASSPGSTPGLTSPSSVLSRSDSLKSAQLPHKHSREHCCISITTVLPQSTAKVDRTAEFSMEWSQRARRWSSTMSRKVNIAALNQTLHSTTSPLLRAGIQELRSIFDVDTIVLDDDPFADTDLELASPNVSRQRSKSDRHYSENSLAAFRQDLAIDAEAGHLVESPDSMSPNFSWESCSLDPSRGSFDMLSSCRIQTDSQGPPSQAGRRDSTAAESPQQAARIETRPNSRRPAYVAVGLTALSVTIVGLCAFETTLHPDVASMPLAIFMLAQPVFALLGIVSLAVQRRWLMDLSSRLVRAHVLGQTLIALAAIRSLSGSAFYGVRHQIPSAGLSMMVLTPSHATINAHTTRVGSLSDQVTYLLVILVQAALPLAFAFWAQYAVASSLSRVSRLSSAPKVTGLASCVTVPNNPSVPKSNDCVSPPTSSPVTIKDRKRLPSGKETSPDTSSDRTLGGEQGLKVTRLGARHALSTCQFQLDAQELSKRLERFAFVPRPLQRNLPTAIPGAPAITNSA